MVSRQSVVEIGQEPRRTEPERGIYNSGKKIPRIWSKRQPGKQKVPQENSKSQKI